MYSIITLVIMVVFRSLNAMYYYKKLNNNVIVYVFFFDFTNAYDVVNRKFIVMKIAKLRIKG